MGGISDVCEKEGEKGKFPLCAIYAGSVRGALPDTDCGGIENAQCWGEREMEQRKSDS